MSILRSRHGVVRPVVAQADVDRFLQTCRRSSDAEMRAGATDVLATLRCDGNEGFSADGYRFLMHWQKRGGKCGSYAERCFEVVRRRRRRAGDFDELEHGNRRRQ